MEATRFSPLRSPLRAPSSRPLFAPPLRAAAVGQRPLLAPPPRSPLRAREEGGIGREEGSEEGGIGRRLLS